MTNATLRARVQAALLKGYRSGKNDWITDATTEVLAAIPEPVPVVRSHTCASGVAITYTAGAERPWSHGGDSEYRSMMVLAVYSPRELSDDDIAACLALRDGVDAKRDENDPAYRRVWESVQIVLNDVAPNWAQGSTKTRHELAISAIRALAAKRDTLTQRAEEWEQRYEASLVQRTALEQRAEAAEARCMELEKLVRMMNTCCADAYKYRDTQSRIIAALEAELALIAAKAGTPVGYANIYSDGSADFSQNREGFEPPTSIIVPCRIAVPVYEAPPTPAKYRVIGACVVKDGKHAGHWHNDYQSQEKCERFARDRVTSDGGTAYQLLRGEVVP